MARGVAVLQRGIRRAIARGDGVCNRLYGWRYNPLYHSGAMVVVLFLVMLATGVYLLLFYRIGAPYASVIRITEQVWWGRWIRALHRYAADGALLAAAMHALRFFAQGRSWGPRTLAWVTGLVLVALLLVCGWTGYVMVWDVQGQVLAQEGARLMDALPIFSEPIARAFDGERLIPGAFFFLNLFAHVALPIGLALLVWLHVSRVARPALLPPRGLLWSAVGLLFLLSVTWPIAAAPGTAADLFRLPGRAPFDAFYSFWLPLARPFQAWVVWIGGAAATLVAITVPLWSRPRPAARPAPSFVDEHLCTGCYQCYLDCPYEAIAMLDRTDGRADHVAHVDPSLCVSCGICAGSCAPMGVGPPGRTGRDQLVIARAFIAARPLGPADVVVIACDRGAGGVAGRAEFRGAPVYPVSCGGSLHTSVIEYLLRAGAGGVLVVSCPPRDCWNREGPKWLEQRIYHDREAELQDRVDRRRIRLTHAAAAEPAVVAGALDELRAAIAALDLARGEPDIDVLHECEPASEEAAS